MSLHTPALDAAIGSWADAAETPAPTPVLSELDRARRDYHSALMSDPSAPGYDRLCSNFETRIRELEQEQEQEPVVAVDAAGAAGHSSSPAPPARDFSVLRSPRSNPFGRRPLLPLPTEPIHGHAAEPCTHCHEPAHCDCPCVVCIGVRREVASAVTAEVIDRLGAPTSAQRALDEQWAGANLGGSGCPFCDSMFGCSCWRERAELRQYAERQQRRADAAVIAQAIREGKCACHLLEDDGDYPVMCEICEREEALRCNNCGKLQCGTECCGGCGGCSRCRTEPECRRCGSYDCSCYEDEEESEDEDEKYQRWKREQWEYGF